MTLTEERANGGNHKCMLNDALKYLSFGWSVVPLRPMSKEPLLSSWTEYQTRLPTTIEISRWFTSSPNANLAILTGKVSMLGVIDVDGEIGRATLAQMGWSSPAVSLTGNGRQLLFQHPGGKIPNAVKKFPGIDVRGDGGYIVAPPSIHPNGKRYTWLTPVFGALDLPLFPTEIFAKPVAVISGQTIGKPAGWISDALKGLSDGNRNDTFASVVGKLHRDRWTPDDIRALLLPHALRVEFAESELDTVIWSITRKPVEIIGRRVNDATKLVARQPLVVRTFDKDFGDYLERKKQNRPMEFPTGYRRFDEITTGLQRGELLVVGARTETGKTNWLLGSAFSLGRRGARVLLLSTEMAYERIWDRYISLGDGAKSHAFSVCDDFTPDCGRIRQAVIDNKVDVFIFDHINIVGDDNETISRFLKSLKEVARELNIPGIVAAQLNRQAEWLDQDGQKIDPKLTHLKGSGAIEETAAQVLLLHEKDDDPDKKYIQGIVAKNRYGEKGTVDFVLRKKPYRMDEL